MADSRSSEDLTALALSLRRDGNFTAARDVALRAIDARKDNASAWFNLAAALAGLGMPSEAEAAYRKALALQPRYAEAWSNLGGLLHAQGRHEEAISSYRSGIAANDRLAPVWSNLGNALCIAGKHAEGEQAARRAIALEPHFAAAWLNLGRALQELKRFPEARDACLRATDLAPQLADAWVGLANALIGTKEFERVVLVYEQALLLQPDNPDFHANLGVALRRIGLADQGLRSMRRALERDPNHAYASWNLSNWLLGRGELAEGWRHYESRWLRPEASQRRYVAKGGFATGGRMLIWGEQGVGDEILYGVMADEVAARGVEVTLEVDVRLVDLFQRSMPTVTVRARSNPPDIDPRQFDHVAPLGSLGQWLRPSLGAFPKHHGYLVADRARTLAYRNWLQQELPGSFMVGIAWRSSNPELGEDKSAALAEWGALLTIPGVTFVNLQYGSVADECHAAVERFGARIVRLPELDVYNDLEGLAALQSACDVVITTSNVNAHITGALGRPGWILLPRQIGRHWYWFQGSEHSAWYPSLTLVPQSRDGDWTSAIAQAAKRLRHRLAGKS